MIREQYVDPHEYHFTLKITCHWYFPYLPTAYPQDDDNFLDNLVPITVENANQVVEIANLGVGYTGIPLWLGDGNILLQPKAIEQVLYDVNNLSNPAHLPPDTLSVEYNFVNRDDIDLSQPVATSPDGQFVVYQISDSNDDEGSVLRIVNTKTNTTITEIAANSVLRFNYFGEIFMPHFSEHGLLFLRDTNLWRWNPSTNNEALLIENTEPFADNYAINSSGDFAAVFTFAPSVSDEGIFQIYDLRTTPATLLHEQIYPPLDRWHSVAISPNSQWVATSGNNSNVRLWDVESRGIDFRDDLPPNEFNEQAVIDLAFSPDGHWIAGNIQTTGDGYAFLRDMETGEQVVTINGISGTGFSSFNSVAFDPSGEILAVSFSDGVVRFWAVEDLIALGEVDGTNAPILLGDQTGPITDVNFSADGTMLATASWDNTVQVWDMNTQQILYRFEGHTQAAWSAVFNPQGTLLATSSEDDTVWLWDLTDGTGQMLAHLTSAYEYDDPHIVALDFSPDGTLLAGSSRDVDVYLWDVATGRQIQLIDGNGQPIWHMEFNSEGTFLVTAGNDTTVRLWGIPSVNQN